MIIKLIIISDIDLYKYEDWLNVGYLATAIKANISNADLNVEVIDFADVNTAAETIAIEKPQCVILSVLQENYNASIAFLSQLKRLSEDTFIVLENRVPSLFADIIMKTNQAVDAVIIGEAEATAVELINKLSKNASMDDCKGILFRSTENRIIRTAPRPLEPNLDKLGFPYRFETKEKVQTYSIKGSRGCTGNCTFCDLGYTKSQPGPLFRAHSIEHIVSEMQMLNRDYHVQHFHFFDDTFCGGEGAGTVEWFQALQTELETKKLDVRFLFNLRAELIDENLAKQLHRMREVGLDHIFFGLESGNEADLRLFNKKATVQDNKRAVKLLQKYNISFDFGFIMFNPYSDFSRLAQNIDFIESTNLFVNCDVMRRRLLLLPGTPILKLLQRDNLLLGDIDDPSIGKMDYRFADDRIERACQAIFDIFNQDPLKAEEHYVRLVSFFNNVEDVLGAEHESTLELKEKIDNFKAASRKYSIDLFRKVLSCAENGEDIQNKLINDIERHNFEIRRFYQEVNSLRIPTALKLHRKHKLLTREILVNHK